MGGKVTWHRHALIPVTTMRRIIHHHVDNTCHNNVFASLMAVEALLRVGVWGLAESFVVPLIREEIGVEQAEARVRSTVASYRDLTQ
jgi:hypothetical protein